MALKYINTLLYGDQDEIKRKEKQWYDQNYDAMKRYVTLLNEGKNVPLNNYQIKNVDHTPSWLDKEMIKKGQNFAKDYLFTICFAELQGLYFLYAIDSIVRPLIFTNKSSTIETAHKRYLATIIRVHSWFREDLFAPDGEAIKNIRAVNQKHLSLLSQMSSKKQEEVEQLTTLKNRLEEDMYVYGCPFLQKDMKKVHKTAVDRMGSENYINQYNMALTQFAFIGLTVLYQEEMGIYVPKEDIEAFIYLWKYIGYLVGMEDKYNLCTGSYDEVIFKCKAMQELIFKPSLTNLTPEWMHMSYVTCIGVDLILDQLVFESTVGIMFDTIGIDCNEYYNTFTWKMTYKYYYLKVLQLLTPIKMFRNYFNQFTTTKLNEAAKKFELRKEKLL